MVVDVVVVMVVVGLGMGLRGDGMSRGHVRFVVSWGGRTHNGQVYAVSCCQIGESDGTGGCM